MTEHDEHCENLRAYPGFPCDCEERKKWDVYDNPQGEFPALEM